MRLPAEGGFGGAPEYVAGEPDFVGQFVEEGERLGRSGGGKYGLVE